MPEYNVEESGPDHQKSFRATVRVGGHVYGTGEGRSKKEAEQQAAETAWNAISNGETLADAADEAAQAGPADTAASAGQGAKISAQGAGGVGQTDSGGAGPSSGRRGNRDTSGNRDTPGNRDTSGNRHAGAGPAE